jgi:hypothetical protein
VQAVVAGEGVAAVDGVASVGIGESAAGSLTMISSSTRASVPETTVALAADRTGHLALRVPDPRSTRRWHAGVFVVTAATG